MDFEEGNRRKKRGMDAAAEARAALLEEVRSYLITLAKRRPSHEVTADDATIYLQERKLPSLGPAAGSLFRGEEWEFTGRWIRSSKVTNHASDLRIWRLKGY